MGYSLVGVAHPAIVDEKTHVCVPVRVVAGGGLAVGVTAPSSKVGKWEDQPIAEEEETRLPMRRHHYWSTESAVVW